MARSLATLPLPDLEPVRSLAAPAEGRRPAGGGVDRGRDVVRARDLCRHHGLAERGRRARAGARPALPRSDPPVAARRGRGAPPGPADRGAPAGPRRARVCTPGSWRCSAWWRSRRRSSSRCSRSRSCITGSRPGSASGSATRCATRERGAGLSRGAQGGDPRRRAGDGRRSQPRRRGAASASPEMFQAPARHPGDAALAHRGGRVPGQRPGGRPQRPGLRARAGTCAARAPSSRRPTARWWS